MTSGTRSPSVAIAHICAAEGSAGYGWPGRHDGMRHQPCRMAACDPCCGGRWWQRRLAGRAHTAPRRVAAAGAPPHHVPLTPLTRLDISWGWSSWGSYSSTSLTRSSASRRWLSSPRAARAGSTGGGVQGGREVGSSTRPYPGQRRAAAAEPCRPKLASIANPGAAPPRPISTLSRPCPVPSLPCSTLLSSAAPCLPRPGLTRHAPQEVGQPARLPVGQRHRARHERVVLVALQHRFGQPRRAVRLRSGQPTAGSV